MIEASTKKKTKPISGYTEFPPILMSCKEYDQVVISGRTIEETYTKLAKFFITKSFI